VVEVSVIGLGPRGRALARALFSGGHRVTIWNRNVAKADPLIHEGTVLADSTIFMSGAEKTFRRSEALLKSMAGTVDYLGERVGSVSALDLVSVSNQERDEV